MIKFLMINFYYQSIDDQLLDDQSIDDQLTYDQLTLTDKTTQSHSDSAALVISSRMNVNVHNNDEEEELGLHKLPSPQQHVMPTIQ